MWLMLINSLILLFALSLPIAGLFWKHFASAGESLKAIAATITGILGLALFFMQVAIMTAMHDQNIITIFISWFSN